MFAAEAKRREIPSTVDFKIMSHSPQPSALKMGIPIPNSKLGLWLFLGTEIMFFTAFIGSYIVLRIGSPGWPTSYDDTHILLLAGGVAKPHGDFHSSMQLLENGAFDRAGFKRLHVAGHPEGNKDIDPDGSMKNVEEALAWKQKFSETTDAEMALATQFAFEAAPIITWATRLAPISTNR